MTPDVITFWSAVELTPQAVADDIASREHVARGTYEMFVAKHDDNNYYYTIVRRNFKPVLAYANGINII